jgi:predicted kinase
MNRDLISKAKKTILIGSRRKTAHPVVVVLMGLPGTGKSYVSRILHEAFHFTVLSGENITRALFGTEKCKSDQYILAYRVLRKLMADCLNRGLYVVVDGTNLRRSYRMQIYRVAAAAGARIQLIEITAPEKVAIRRLFSRTAENTEPTAAKSKYSLRTFESFKRQLESPQPNERPILLVSNKRVKYQLSRILKRVV